MGDAAAADGRAAESGTERVAILGYFEDGPNLVTMAMNGWGDPEPAWWLNLQARPDAVVELVDGQRTVRSPCGGRGGARAPVGQLGALRPGARRLTLRDASRQTAVVIFEPRPDEATPPGP